MRGFYYQRADTLETQILDIKKPAISWFFYEIWCPETDLNRHDHKSRDFKSLVSTDFTTRAKIVMEAEPGVEPRWMDLQSTAWPLCHSAKTFGAVHETRTRDPDLGKVVLYQLS